MIEQNVENALNLPSGTLNDKLDFMVQPLDAQDDKKESNKKGD